MRFALGECIARMELSPQLTRAQHRQLKFWIERLPEVFLERLPLLKLAVADQLAVAGSRLVLGELPRKGNSRPGTYTHAASFLPDCYVVLGASLFRQRVELGRILYHELCHFLWPRLGNPSRAKFQAMLEREFRKGVAGELGYSAEWRKAKLRTEGTAGSFLKKSDRAWREYLCESFCDTGSFVLLGGERRVNHSEYTLSRAVRRRRLREWQKIVFRKPLNRGKDSLLQRRTSRRARQTAW